MQKPGTLKFQAHHSCNLSWVWVAVSPLLSLMECDWSTLRTVVSTGLSSPQSVCPQPLVVLVILRVPSTLQHSTNTGGGSLFTCPVLLSMCFKLLDPTFVGSWAVYISIMKSINVLSDFYWELVKSLSSPRTRFRWIQTYFTPGAEGWALDNVLLAPGCPWMCSGHGLCDNGRCL